MPGHRFVLHLSMGALWHIYHQLERLKEVRGGARGGATGGEGRC